MKTLIVSPHMDDEVLGCASFLGAGTSPATDALVLYVTAHHPNARSLRIESEALRKRYGFRAWFAEPAISRATNELDNVGQDKLINLIESVIREWKPDTLVIPPRSYNQDHRAVHDAALTASRPHDRNWFVPRVLVFEEPETFAPSPAGMGGITPTYYRPLNVETKIEMYRIYASQVRGHRSEDMLRALARVRGMVANVGYAEAFEVVRWVE